MGGIKHAGEYIKKKNGGGQKARGKVMLAEWGIDSVGRHVLDWVWGVKQPLLRAPTVWAGGVVGFFGGVVGVRGGKEVGGHRSSGLYRAAVGSGGGGRR